MWRDPLWWLAAVVPAAVFFGARRTKRPTLRFPSTEGLEPLQQRSRPAWLRLPLLLRLAALACIVAALARLQQGVESSRVRAEGIDIVLAIDVSTSMLAEDFTLGGQRRNRLDVVKDVVKRFIEARDQDRIGLVVFAGRAYTQSPLTLDHGWLLTQLEQARIGLIEDGTAIGSGIATGLNRLRASRAKSRIMVVLTDGVNNAGTITPDAAAEMAKALNVKLYTIGAGTRGRAPYPARDVFGRRVYQQIEVEVDDAGLTNVAEATGGRYFRATDTASLEQIYREIDRMEKDAIQQPTYLAYREWYPWFVIPAIMLLLAEVAVSRTWLRALP